MSKFQMYDLILANSNIDSMVLKGCKGTILMIYNSNPPQYEVEFVDNESETIAILTVLEKDIAKY